MRITKVHSFGFFTLRIAAVMFAFFNVVDSTLTPSQSATCSASASRTALPSFVGSQSLTQSSSESLSPTSSQSFTQSQSPTSTRSESSSTSRSSSATQSQSGSLTPTASQAPTISQTPSQTTSSSQTRSPIPAFCSYVVGGTCYISSSIVASNCSGSRSIFNISGDINVQDLDVCSLFYNGNVRILSNVTLSCNAPEVCHIILNVTGRIDMDNGTFVTVRIFCCEVICSIDDSLKAQ